MVILYGHAFRNVLIAGCSMGRPSRRERDRIARSRRRDTEAGIPRRGLPADTLPVTIRMRHRACSDSYAAD
jgi:hypothetical protein